MRMAAVKNLCLITVLIGISPPGETLASTNNRFFYPYGSSAGDTLHPAVDDACSIRFNKDIRLFGVHHSSIYVCTNGILSLPSSYTKYTPTSFPLRSGVGIIAPFWADADLQKGGKLWARLTTIDSNLLKNVSSTVSKFYKTTFTASWLLIATWDNVIAYDGSSSSPRNPETNSYQCVVAADDNGNTYVLYLYGGIQWTFGSASSSVHAQVGFDVGDGINYYAQTASQKPGIIGVASGSNSGETGRWMYKLGNTTIIPPKINECAERTDNCDNNADCTDLPSGFTCACRFGFNDTSPSGLSGINCTDFDECTLNNTLCMGEGAMCVNTQGSYHCQCPGGMRGDGVGIHSCNDIDECKLQTHDCDMNAGCENTIGGYTCTCKPGYIDTSVSGRNGTKCEDECTLQTHDCDVNADCKNTTGGYTCTCRDGFHDISGNGTQCEDGIVCPDETRVCSKNAECGYFFGSNPPWICTCKPGYDGDGFTCTMTEVNECAEKTDNCDNDADCTDLPSGFTCTCRPGFNDTSPKGQPGTECTDYDECSHNKSLCMGEGAKCVNTPGSYHCQCPEGMKGDGASPYSCNDGPICPDYTTICSKDAMCVYTWGGNPIWSCTCKAGYLGNGHKCTDNNDCAEGSDLCDDNADCTNTPGSYTCTCRNGYNDTSGDGTLCQDIDECTLQTHDCDFNADCKNTIGGYTCTCRDGFNDTNGNGTACENLNECKLDRHDCDINADCENTMGGYTCTCRYGFNDTSGNGSKCEDLDECSLQTHDCDMNADCENTIGGYLCECHDGYNDISLNGRNGTQCRDTDECALQTYGCDVNADCKNTDGSYTCTCKDGYKDTSGLGRNETKCQDIDECHSNTDDCDEDALCKNTMGRYTCTCKYGYKDTSGQGRNGTQCAGTESKTAKCPTVITAVASRQTNMAQVDLNLGGDTVHRLSLPIGLYKYDTFTKEGVNCSLSVRVADPWTMRRLEFRASYNVSCSPLWNPITLSTVKNLVKDNYKTIQIICQQDCGSDSNQDAVLSCESGVLSVTWPTDRIYTGDVTQLPSDIQSRLRGKIIGLLLHPSALRLVVINRNPPIVYPSLTENGGYVKAILTSFCDGNRMYQASDDSCV